MKRGICATGALALVSALASGSALGADRAMIVLDASGSMWGQIDGKTKIEIARETLAGVLGSVSGELELGLIAYGHRRKGDCRDIELLVPAAAGTGPAIGAAAVELQPKGKTPLSEAVVQAAESLKYIEDKATVILITDGLETCDQDPCAVADSLAASGVDFTTHVVGFGLSEEEGRQVACLAENTGGRYFSAEDAEQLGAALTETVTAAAEPEPVPEPAPELEATLSAPEQVEQAAMFEVAWEGPGDRYDAIQIFDPQARNGEGKVIRSATVAHGDIEKRLVTLAAPAKLGRFELRYWDGRGRRVIGTRPVEVTEASVSLSAPESVEIGRPIVVEWHGPGERYDAIQLFDPSAMHGEGKVLHDKRLRNDDFENHKATLPGPAEPGSYELRYWNGENKAVLATSPIEVIEGEVSLSAPDTVEAGRVIKVEWMGPGARYDAVELYDPQARQGEGAKVRDKRLRNDDFENRRVSLTAPAEAGLYELRYWNGDNKKVLVTRPIEVVEVEVSLSAPDSVSQGATITVEWEGPGGRYDAVQIVDPNSGGDRPIRDKRLRNDDFDHNRASLPAPAEPGVYELRYWNGENKAVMASRHITVVEAEVSLSAPDRVAAGETFVVGWIGPGARYDDLQIVDEAEKKHRGRRLGSDRSGGMGEIKLKAPDAPGQYELRYWNGDNKAVLATRPLVVE